MIGFGFIFDWLKKDVVSDFPNGNNIIFRIKILRIIILITKHEYSRCSNKYHKQCVETRKKNLEVKTGT